MEGIFNSLYTALYGNLAIAALASFLWGIASVLLSPCHLSSIPLVVAMLMGKRTLSIKQTFRLSLLFSVGVLLSIALIGVITALLGRMLGDLGSHANLIFGIALCLGGILLLDIIPIGSISFISKLKPDGTKPLVVFIVGLLFGLALGPCAFAFMAPVLTLAFSLGATNMPMAIIIMLVYGVGHCMVIVFAGTSLGMVQKVLNWNEGSRGLIILKRLCAVLVIAAGVYLIFK
ncbi:MAG: cytochrome C biogenesis protein [Candidatus Cloacimonetes bacterium HGW-Cloacimonetes-3]|jgi:cytochrome c-type biogenesis protein|nr:MAG: cytochrome C biogenesis protein [Candidatus Cloacimonetes bacterium HGW-Cloacimonetes-3]PKN96272.1 MAG: cytochrome C biogenesis protein [Chloroflexi bacterium HGW-Chloroflexi-5]